MKYSSAIACSMAVIAALLVPASVIAQEALNANTLKVGGRPQGSTVAKFAQGTWGKRSACPILLQRNEPKVAIYARQLDVPSLAIAKAVDQIIADYPSLKWSFLMVDNSRSPERQLESRLTLVEEAAANYELQNLSLGLFSTIEASARGPNTRGRKQLTVLGEHDIVVSLVMPKATDTSDQPKTPMVAYVKSLRSSMVDSEVVRQVATEIRRSFTEHTKRITIEALTSPSGDVGRGGC